MAMTSFFGKPTLPYSGLREVYKGDIFSKYCLGNKIINFG